MLWPNFEFIWPLLNNPDPKLFPPPKEVISPWGLPLLNTVLLVSSSVTVTIAHHALKKGHRGALKIWLALTVLLGCAFLGFQAEEYMHAYHELGLTLGSGIYGATFFMLQGGYLLGGLQHRSTIGERAPADLIALALIHRWRQPDPVVQHQERKPEDPEGVLGPQLAVVDVDVELLGEAVHGQRGELAGCRGRCRSGSGRAGRQVAAAGQRQAAAGSRPGHQRGGEAGLRQREADADVPAAVVPVGRVDADVDRLVGVGERPDPAADRDAVVVGRRDRVDPAADAALRLALVHRHVGLAERPGDQRAVEQVARAAPRAATRARCRA